MKTRFSSNSQLCHVWAQQTQAAGRANNMFFEGADIYSYGHHYLAARVYKKHRIALVRVDPYSNTTAKHLADIRRALQGLMPYFLVSDVTDLKAAVKELDERATQAIAEGMKRRVFNRQEDARWTIEQVEEAYKEASELREALGRATIEPPKAAMEDLKAHVAKLQKRYYERNTPEAIATREAEQARKAEAKLAGAIAEFRSSGRAIRESMPYDLLRVSGDDVLTSRGARVPLREARALYRAIEQGRDVLGAKVGEFTVTAVRPYMGADKVVYVGCHRILLSEAAKALGGV